MSSQAIILLGIGIAAAVALGSGGGTTETKGKAFTLTADCHDIEWTTEGKWIAADAIDRIMAANPGLGSRAYAAMMLSELVPECHGRFPPQADDVASGYASIWSDSVYMARYVMMIRGISDPDAPEGSEGDVDVGVLPGAPAEPGAPETPDAPDPGTYTPPPVEDFQG